MFNSSQKNLRLVLVYPIKLLCLSIQLNLLCLCCYVIMLYRLITRHNTTSNALFHRSKKEKYFHRHVNCQNKHLGTSSLVDLDIRENGVIVVSLNRPEARNALNTSLAIQLNEVFEGLKDKSIKPKGNSSVKALVLTGHGKAFCAGADLKERLGMSEEQWDAQHKIFQKCCRTFQRLPIPLIAAANGHAFGGGLELICLSDWAYASEKALFGFPEVRLGIFPGLGGTQTLPRLIGINAARRLILTGATFTATEGHHLGLFSKLEANGEATLEAAVSDANEIAKNGPLAVKLAKRAIWEGHQTSSFDDAWKLSLELYGKAFKSSERVEGINAYNGKRSPKFE